VPAKSASVSIKPRFLIASGRRFVFGPGKAELLEHITQTGSISQAAKAMGMSYMRAWTLIKSLEDGFAEPLVTRLRGGSARGGAELTETGREVLKLYRELETRTSDATRDLEPRLTALLRTPRA
jgi:molybdate transport system regulatory protein